MAPRAIRPIRVEGNVAYVPLTRGYEAIIDADSAPLVSEWNWCAKVDTLSDGSVRSVYAYRSSMKPRRAVFYLHKAILTVEDGQHVDHVDGNGLNNRRSNLRPASPSENQHNRKRLSKTVSGLKGVSRAPRSPKWRARIKINGQERVVGLFDTKEAAHAAYIKAAMALHGDFARW